MSISKLTTEQIELRWRLDQGALAALPGLLANRYSGVQSRPNVLDALTTIGEQAYAAAMMLERARKEAHYLLEQEGE